MYKANEDGLKKVRKKGLFNDPLLCSVVFASHALLTHMHIPGKLVYIPEDYRKETS